MTFLANILKRKYFIHMPRLVETRKQVKRNHVLSLLRESRHNLSRADVRRLTGYSVSTVSTIIEELLRERLIVEQGVPEENRMGRKPTLLSLNPEGGYLIGIECNVQGIRFAVLDWTTQILFHGSEGFHEKITKDVLLEAIYEATRRCLQWLGPRRNRVIGIGLGIPGYLDIVQGVALSLPSLPTWKNLPIKEMMNKTFQIPTEVGNNVGVMGLVFKWIPRYHIKDDFLLVSIRAGVRCIPFLSNQPYFGKICNSGELGHLKVSEHQKLCDCGQYGCLNTEIADPYLEKVLEHGLKEGKFPGVKAYAGTALPSIQNLVDAALGEDADSIALIQTSARYLGKALAEAANLFAPQRIIVSGSLAKAADLFFIPLKEWTAKTCVPSIMEHLTIQPSPFDSTIGAIGAATLVLERNFNPQMGWD